MARLFCQGGEAAPAIGRQTDRVFGLKTISKESLLQLREVDFEDSPNQVWVGEYCPVVVWLGYATSPHFPI